MKKGLMVALMTSILAALALAQESSYPLVKGSPTNYGAYGFDISWIDANTQKYYLTDRTNNAIDFVDAATDTFIGFIGKGNYTGSRPCPGQPKNYGTVQVPTASLRTISVMYGPETAPVTSSKPMPRSPVRRLFERSRRAVHIAWMSSLMIRTTKS